MSDSLTERQDYQAQLQAIYAQLPAWELSEPPTALSARLRETLTALEEIRAALPEAVNQGKVLAAVHILRSVLDALE